MNIDGFNRIVGETIFNCQRIENDIKYIYAGMLKGDFARNKYDINNLTLGTVLTDLEELDNSDGNPYLTQDEYKLLREITRVRNWLVHRAYSDFIYSDESELSHNYNRSLKKLTDFNRRIEQLGNQVERVRLDVLKHYGRI